MDSIRDTLNFISISLVEVNANIFKNHGADTFGQDEAFVLKFLQERGLSYSIYNYLLLTMLKCIRYNIFKKF